MGYNIMALGSPVTHQLFMDDLKVYVHTKQGLSTTVNVVERLSKAIGMELDLSKCAVVHMVEHDIHVEDYTLLAKKGNQLHEKLKHPICMQCGHISRMVSL